MARRGSPSLVFGVRSHARWTQPNRRPGALISRRPPVASTGEAGGSFRFIIDDEPLRRLKQAAGARLLWLRTCGAKARMLARALGLGLPRASVIVVHVEEHTPGSRARSKRYEKVSLADAVASSIMQRYGIEEVFSHKKDPEALSRSPP